MVSRLSNQTIQYNTLLALFSLLIIYFMGSVLRQSLSCIDSNGCLLKHCQCVRFSEDY